MKKKTEILVMTLVIFAIVFPIADAINVKNMKYNIRTTLYNNNILYVGGLGTGNYSSIQDAVDNASDSDTIFVYDESSPYYETIKISWKSINLIGENKNTTIIDGMNESNVIYVNSDNIRISGFTIRNSSKTGTNYRAGIFVYVNSDYVNIVGNKLCNNYYGILFYYSGPHNEYSKTETYRLTDCIISGNNISNNYIGMYLRYSDDNEIYNNTISNNNLGVWLLNSYNNKIYLNNFINNKENAYDDCNNLWYNTLLLRGNYWYNYNGPDDLPPIGIGDTPYRFPEGGVDRFPLMNPYQGEPTNKNKIKKAPDLDQVSNFIAQLFYRIKSFQKLELETPAILKYFLKNFINRSRCMLI